MLDRSFEDHTLLFRDFRNALVPAEVGKVLSLEVWSVIRYHVWRDSVVYITTMKKY